MATPERTERTEPPAEPDRIGVRELRQNASVYLARVKAGEALVVTERGEPIATLRPYVAGPRRETWQDMLDSGLIRPPRVPGGVRDLPPPIKLPPGVTTQQWVDYEREERLP